MRCKLHIKSILFLLAATFLSVNSQSKDSLLNSLSQLSPGQQVEQLIDMAWKNRSSDPSIALEYGQKALDICNNNELKKQPEILNILGVVYRNIGELETSYEHYKEALKLATEYSDSSQVAYSNNNIGGYYRLIGSYSKAIEYMLQAMRVFERIGDKQGVGFCAINIGILFRRQDEYDKARQYLNRTIEIRQELNDRQGLALALNQIAEIDFQEKKYDKAKENYEDLLEIYKEINEEKGIAAVYAGLGGVYFQMKKYYIALDYRTKALSIDRKINNKYGVITNLTNLGNIFTQLRNFTEAEKNLSEALQFVREAGYLDLEMDVYKSFSNLALAKKDYKNAFEFHQKKDIIRDSLFNEEKVEIITDFTTAYESDKKELENSILKKDIEYEKVLRYSFIIILFLIIILGGVNWRRIRSHKKANKLLKELNITKDKFFKILAHDLKNPFNTIMGYSEILIEDFNEMKEDEKLQLIKDMNNSSKKLYRLLENLLRWVDTQSGTLQLRPMKINLYEAVEEVLNLFYHVAADKELKVINTISKEQIVFIDENSLNFILRNLFNNAIKYSRKSGAIVWGVEDPGGDEIILSLKDEGIGIKEEDQYKIFNLEKIHSTLGTENEAGTGLGLVLVKEFIEKNGGKIWFETEAGKGTTFFVALCKTS